MAFWAVKKGCGDLDLTAMGDPALVGEAKASTVDLELAVTVAVEASPEATTRDAACALGSISTQVLALVIKESFGGMATVLSATLVGGVKTWTCALGTVRLASCFKELATTSFDDIATVVAVATLVGSFDCDLEVAQVFSGSNESIWISIGANRDASIISFGDKVLAPDRAAATLVGTPEGSIGLSAVATAPSPVVAVEADASFGGVVAVA